MKYASGINNNKKVSVSSSELVCEKSTAEFTKQ